MRAVSRSMLVSMVVAPPAEVIRSFGGDPAALVALEGGEGTSWRAGNIVLKPGARREEVGWIAAFVDMLDLDERVRVSKYVRGAGGGYVCAGWAATEWLAGQHRNDRWNETLASARTFHEAAERAPTEWPAFMSDRVDPWSRATRVAWGEEPPPSLPSAAATLVEAMIDIALDAPATERFQVIHSDLAGNVLFADEAGLPPAIIDISPQYRSVPYAEAILVADAVAWNGAPLHFVEQFLAASRARAAETARAIIFRVATAAFFPGSTPERVVGEAHGYQRIVPALAQ